MNDIAKTNIKERLEKAIESEKLLAQDVASIFGLHPSYISWIKNPKYWERCPVSFWDKLLLWANSGQGLREYAEKHGKVLPEKQEHETIISSVDKTLLSEEPRIKVKPGVLEKRMKELALRDSMAVNKPENQKIIIDIEINLIINGKKITF